MTDLQPLDFAATWHAYADYNNRDRLTDAQERALWEHRAAHYDSRLGPESCTETLKALLSYMQPGDRVLEIGPGTGRFTLPVAAEVGHVTALDVAPAMLAVLRDKAEARGITNVTPVEAAWEDAPIEPHDVVFAAWSLYRQRDMLTGLRKMADVARRALIIIDGDHGPHPEGEMPHDALAKATWGSDPGISNYLYFAGMLRQIGLRAEVRVVYEEQHFTGKSPHEVTANFIPQNAAPDEIDAFRKQMQPYITRSEDTASFSYTCSVPIGLVVWHRR